MQKLTENRVLTKIRFLVRGIPILFRTIINLLANANRIMLGSFHLLYLDYPVKPVPRYGEGKPPHPQLYQLLNQNRETYAATLKQFLSLETMLQKIPAQTSSDPSVPCWDNEWLPVLDALALYGFIALKQPRHYLEVGSGYSTAFAKRAIQDHQLFTQITSIDPHPRKEIDDLCNHILRSTLEETDLKVFDTLEAGDILFMDGSHRCFPNSDVTVFFLDVLPRLKRGVWFGIHDIFLPYDYPVQGFGEKYYSEQYLLASTLLAYGNRFHLALPNHFISKDQTLAQILKRWTSLGSGPASAFWMQIK